MKRLLAMLLALSMVISLLPATVLAEEGIEEETFLEEQLEEPQEEPQEEPEKETEPAAEETTEPTEEETTAPTGEDPTDPSEETTAPTEEETLPPAEEEATEPSEEEPISEEAALEAGETFGTCGEKLTWAYDDATKTLTVSGMGTMSDYEYDSEMGKNTAPWADLNVQTLVIGEGVTYIGRYAFYKMASITAVTLNEGLETIGGAAFGSCENMALTGDFPDSLREIGPTAFFDCNALTGELIFGSELTTLRVNAFAYTGVTKVTLPDGLTAENYDPKAFMGCERLTEILVSEENKNFRSIDGVLYSYDGKTLFSGPSGKTGTLTVPDGVETIKENAFYNGHITEVSLPATIKTVEERAFDDSKVQTVIYAGTRKDGQNISIGEEAFPENAVWKYPNDRTCGENLTWAYDENTKTLTISGTGEMYDFEYDRDREKAITPWMDLDVKTLVLNEGVTTVGAYAFDEMTSLTGALVLPGSMKIIGNNALDGTGLTSVTLNEGLTEIGYRAFGDSKMLTLQGGFPKSLEVIETYAFVNCGRITGEVSFGESLQKLSWSSFAATGITKVTLPDGLRADNYANDAFAGCESLTEILVSDSHPDFQTVDGVLYSKDGTTLISGPAGKTGTLVVPEGVTTIKRGAFENGRITAVSLPKSLQTIEWGAFDDAPIRRVTYGGTQAEKDAIDIADRNDALLNVTWKTADMPGAGEAWTYDEKTKTLTVSGTGDMADYSAENPAPWQGKDVAKLIVQEGVTYIGSHAFAGLNIKNMSLPESLEAAGEDAFADTPKAIQITYAGSNERWTYGFNKESWGLEEPKVTAKGKNVTGDLTWSFNAKNGTMTLSGSGEMDDYYNDKPEWISWEIPVQKLVFLDNVTYIGHSAFAGMQSLQQVTLPKKLEVIGQSAFNGSGLTGKLTVPTDTRYIYKRAFRGTAITALELPAGIKLLEDAFADCGSLTEITYGGSEAVLREMLGDSVSEAVMIHAQKPNGGALGDYTYWELDKQGTLTLSINGFGFGIIPDYKSYEETPWAGQTVKKLVVSDGIIGIGANAFSGCESLTGELTLPDRLLYIGDRAFANTGIKTLRINIDMPKEYLQSVAGGDMPIGYAKNAFEGSKLTDVYYSFAETYLREFLGEDHPLLGKKLHCAYPYGGHEYMGGGELWNIWTVDSKGTLRITCEGYSAILDYEPLEAPWSQYKVTAVELPEELYYIGRNAFYGMADLKKLTLPDGLEAIGEKAFYGCTGITGSLVIPEGVVDIGDAAFGNLPKVTALTLPASLDYLGEDVFAGCTGLKTVTYAGSLAQLMRLDYTLAECGAKVTCQGSSEDTLECGAIWTLDNKGTLTIEGQGTLTLGYEEKYMFRDLGVRKLVILPGITEIGDTAFNYMDMTEVSLPEGLEKLGAEVFAGCENLTKITLPASLRELGEYSLDNYYLKTVSVAKGSKSLTVKSGVLYTADMTKLLLVPAGVKKLTLPDSVTTIVDHALSNKSLTSLTLGAGFAPLARNTPYNNYSMFSDGTRLSSISVSKKNPYFRVEDNVLFEGNALAVYPVNRPGTEYRVPEEITEIASGAVYDPEQLNRMILPATLEVSHPFGIRSSTLELVVLGSETRLMGSNLCYHGLCLPDSQAMYDFESYGIDYDYLNLEETAQIAFEAPEGTTGIPAPLSGSFGTQVTIPKKAPSLKGYTFLGWLAATTNIGLEIVYQPGTTLSLAGNMTLTAQFRKNGVAQEGRVGENAYWTLEKNGTLTIFGKGAAEEHLEPEGREPITAKKLVIEEGITRLDRIFDEDYVLIKGEVQIPASLETIGEEAFYGQKGITKLTFASSMNTKGLVIEDYAFEGCTGLKGAVTLPAQLVSMEPSAFDGCSNVTALNTETLYTKGGLISSDGVLYGAGGGVLLRCPEGKTGAITIPISTRMIAEGAFRNSRVATIYYQNGETKWTEIEGRGQLPVYPTFAYEIIYGVDGGENVSWTSYLTFQNPNPKSVTANQAISLKNPTMDGFIFRGWYQDGTKVTKLPKGTSDTVSLMAHFDPITYTVAYNANGGKGKMDKTPGTYDQKLTIAENLFEKTGYQFVGWNTAKNGSGEWYDEEDVVGNLTTKNKATVTLYAQWKANDYAVIFDANGGEGNTEPQHLVYDKTEALTPNAFTREGYTFTGWNTQPDGKGKTYKDKAKVKNLVAEDSIVLYAQWKQAK